MYVSLVPAMMSYIKMSFIKTVTRYSKTSAGQQTVTNLNINKKADNSCVGVVLSFRKISNCVLPYRIRYYTEFNLTT